MGFEIQIRVCQREKRKGKEISGLEERIWNSKEIWKISVVSLWVSR